LWFCWLCWVDSPPEPQRKNIKTFRRGEAPFHRVARPDKSEEIRLGRLYRAGDVIAGNTLIASHIWITKTIAKKYQDEAELDDLVQEGTFGLYKALQKFDPDSDRRFSTLAYRAVAWAIRDYLDKLRQLQRHESSDEITDKGGSDALGLHRSISVERKILFD
jgi:DNA-directed RNA polymerase sigma subunit (sigma70/sigma32)